MSTSVKSSWHLINGLDPDVVAAADVWGTLEDFLKRLQGRGEINRQLRLVLDMVHQATRADAVFLCSAQPGHPVESVGRVPLEPEWCRVFLAHVLRQSRPGGGQFLSDCRATAPPGEAAPHSAALVRLSKSRQAWVVALSFDPARRFRPDDVRLMRLARRMLVQHNQHGHACEQLEDTLLGLVRCLTASLDARDPYTWGHSERVARIGARLGRETGLSETEANDLYLGGLLHDIGKIGVRDSVLTKAGPLTAEERTLIERHTVIGDAILSHVTQLAHLRPVVRSHHEHFDGGGYPDRLAGEAIPLSARILAVADSCDAMLSDRPYRPGMPIARFEQILTEGAGRQWDPVVVRHFDRCRAELYEIYRQGRGESVSRAVEQALRGGRDPADAPSVWNLAAPPPGSS